MPPDATATRKPIEIPPDLAPETHTIGATRNPGPRVAAFAAERKNRVKGTSQRSQR